jgi:quinol monooxygenase YgiN
VYLVVTHLHVGFKVKNYEQWKQGYDASLEQRKASGEISFQVFRNVNDPNTVTVLSVQQSAEQVQAFMDSPDLKARMKASGITQMGQMLILEEMDSGTH